MIPPLAIIQARLHSERLPRKMLIEIGGHPLLWWAWSRTIERYGRDHTVIASPAADVPALRAAVPEAYFFGWQGPAWDVLGRIHACAHQRRHSPDATIVRVTPDDWPVELDREVCCLGHLDVLEAQTPVGDQFHREHIGYLLGGVPLTVLPGTIEINTAEDVALARRRYVESH